MSAKDMCLIEKIPELIAAGVSSFKIEGRMKSEYYLATIVSNYRKVIDQAFYHKPIDQKCYTDVLNAANRPVDTAWYDGIPNMHKMLYHEDERKVVQNYAFRIINKIDDQHYDIIVMNHMKQVFTYEVLDMKTNTVVPIIIKELFNDQNKIVDVLPTPMMHAKITLAHPVDLVVGDIGRIKN
jgi:putative protease